MPTKLTLMTETVSALTKTKRRLGILPRSSRQKAYLLVSQDSFNLGATEKELENKAKSKLPTPLLKGINFIELVAMDIASPFVRTYKGGKRIYKKNAKNATNRYRAIQGKDPLPPVPKECKMGNRTVVENIKIAIPVYVLTGKRACKRIKRWVTDLHLALQRKDPLPKTEPTFEYINTPYKWFIKIKNQTNTLSENRQTVLGVRRVTKAQKKIRSASIAHRKAMAALSPIQRLFYSLTY